jgi:hypothetical protein
MRGHLYCVCYIALRFPVKQNKGLSWMCFGISGAILAVVKNSHGFTPHQSKTGLAGGEKAMGHPAPTWSKRLVVQDKGRPPIQIRFHFGNVLYALRRRLRASLRQRGRALLFSLFPRAYPTPTTAKAAVVGDPGYAPGLKEIPPVPHPKDRKQQRSLGPRFRAGAKW